MSAQPFSRADRNRVNPKASRRKRAKPTPTAIRLIAWNVGPNRTAFVGIAIGSAMLDVPVGHRHLFEVASAEARAAASFLGLGYRGRIYGDEGAGADRLMTEHLARPRMKP